MNRQELKSELNKIIHSKDVDAVIFFEVLQELTRDMSDFADDIGINKIDVMFWMSISERIGILKNDLEALVEEHNP